MQIVMMSRGKSARTWPQKGWMSTFVGLAGGVPSPYYCVRDAHGIRYRSE